MTARPPSHHRLLAQIGVIRQLIACGETVAARRACAALFLDHLPALMRERGLLEGIVECLLLLEMAALLPRLVRAACGVDLEMSKRGGPEARHWTLHFSNGISLLVPVAAVLREGAGPEWARRVLQMAEAAPPGEREGPRALKRVLSIV